MRKASIGLVAVMVAVAAPAAVARPARRADAEAHARLDDGDPEATTASLWALCPRDAHAGLVATPAALRRLEGMAAVIARLADQLPALARYRSSMWLWVGRDLAAAGLSPARGAAVFSFGNHLVVFPPVVDRAKFVKATGGRRVGARDLVMGATCRTVQGRYACSDLPALLDKVRVAPTRRGTPLVGDVEVWLRGDALNGVTLPDDAYAAATIAPGRIEVRAHVALDGWPLSLLAPGARLRAAGVEDASGFVIADVAPLFALLPRRVSAALDAYARLLRGPLTIVAPAGADDWDVRAALTDPKAIAAALAACDRGLPVPLPFDGTPGRGACHLRPHAGADPGKAPPPGLDAWVDGDQLRVARDHAHPAHARDRGTLTEVGRELADGTWTMATWGRGGLLGDDGALRDWAKDWTHPAVLALDELGLGVRADPHGADVLIYASTIWDDPQGADTLEPLLVRQAQGQAIDAGAASPGDRGVRLPLGALAIVLDAYVLTR